MKKVFLLLLSATVLISSCKEKKKPGDITIKSDDGNSSVTINTNDMSNAADAMQKKVEELQKLTPLTNDQLKALLPETFMTGKRVSYEAQSNMGYAIANAKYEINDSTNIELSIIDCAGPSGSGLYGLRFFNLFNIDKDNQDEYEKTIDFNGGKAIEKCQKQRPECTLTFFANDRLLVTLEGENLNISSIKGAAGQLNFKVN